MLLKNKRLDQLSLVEFYSLAGATIKVKKTKQIFVYYWLLSMDISQLTEEVEIVEIPLAEVLTGSDDKSIEFMFTLKLSKKEEDLTHDNAGKLYPLSTQTLREIGIVFPDNK